MAIKEVTKGVYTIDVEVTDAKTSRGTGYATLVSDLRWKLWEQTQERELGKVKFEQEAYLDAKKALADQIKQHRKFIADVAIGNLEAQDAMEKANAGFRVSLDKARMSAEVAGRPRTSTSVYSGTSTGRSRRGTGDDKLTAKDSSVVGRVVADAIGEARGNFYTAVDEAAVIGDSAVGRGGEVTEGMEDVFRGAVLNRLLNAAEADADKRGLTQEEKEQFIESLRSRAPQKYRQSSDALIDNADAPVASSGTRVTTSSRDTTGIVPSEFEDITSASRAAELARLNNELLALQAEAAAIESPNYDMLQRSRTAHANAYGNGVWGMDRRPQRELQFFDEAEALRQSKELLDLHIQEEMNKLPSTATEDDIRVARLLGVKKANAFAIGEGRGPTGSPFLMREPDFAGADPTIERADTRMRVPRPDRVKPQSMPAYPVSPVRPVTGVASPMSSISNAPVPPQGGRGSDGQVLSLGSEMTNQNLISDYYGLSSEEIEELNALGVKPPNTFGRPPPPNQVAPSTSIPSASGPLLVEPGTEPSKPRGKQNPFDEEYPDGFWPEDTDLSPLPPSGGSNKPKQTDKQRMFNYRTDVIVAGAKLAEQNKKMERLTKPSLPDSKRKEKVPEYVILVENLYETNKQAGAEPVKATYDELNRVYKDQPDIRKKAQEFLIAFDILENKSETPMQNRSPIPKATI